MLLKSIGIYLLIAISMLLLSLLEADATPY